VNDDGLAWKRFKCWLFGHGTDQNDGRPSVVSNIVTNPDGRLVHTHDFCERCQGVMYIANRDEFARWFAAQWTITARGPDENLYQARKP